MQAFFRLVLATHPLTLGLAGFGAAGGSPRGSHRPEPLRPTRPPHHNQLIERTSWFYEAVTFSETMKSHVRVSADPGDPADLGNDSLPDAVVEHLRNDALRSDIFDGFDRRLLPRRSPEHDH